MQLAQEHQRRYLDQAPKKFLLEHLLHMVRRMPSLATAPSAQGLSPKAKHVLVGDARATPVEHVGSECDLALAH